MTYSNSWYKKEYLLGLTGMGGGAAGILIGGGPISTGEDGYQIGKSLRFSREDEAYLLKTFGEGNQRIFTVSFWVKRTEIGGSNELDILHAADGSGPRSFIGFNNSNSDRLHIGFNPSGSSWFYVKTERSFRDPSAWYHIVVAVDTAQAENTDRVKLYINGIKETTFSQYDTITQHLETNINGAVATAIGRYQHGSGSNYLNGSLADFQFIDGLVLSPAAFGSFNSTGVWNPKKTTDDDGKFILPAPNANYTYSAGSNWTASSGTLSNITNVFDGSSITQLSSSAAGATFDFVLPTEIEVATSVEITQGGFNGKYQLNYGEDGETLLTQTVANQGWNYYPFTGTLKNIRIVCAAGNTLNTRAIRIDGVLLIDGQTDPATRTNRNNGTKWSDSTSGGGAEHGSYPKTNAFNGNFSNLGSGIISGGGFVFEPSGGISYTNSVKIRTGTSGVTVGSQAIEINDGTAFNVNADDIWVTVASGSGTLNKLAITASNDGNSYAYLAALEIDGHVLVDDTVDNSFHLKFNDATKDRYLGKDTLKGKIADATGGLPIYNTTDDYGDVKGSGYRSDSNSANLILALPLDASAATSVEATIHGSGTNKSLTNGPGNSYNSNSSRFYGVSSEYRATNQSTADQSVAVAAHADWDIGTGDLTVEAWLYKDSGHSGNDYLFDQSGNDFTTYWHSSNGVSFAGVSNSAVILDTADIPISQWFHFATVRTSGTFKTYINGVLKKTIAGNWDVGDSSKVLYVGRKQSGYDAGWMGRIQDFRIYKTAKYSSEFITPNRNDFTVNNLQVASPVTTDKSVANATGALPIFNTSDTYGHVSSGSERTDSVSQQFLFLPMNGTQDATTFTDVSNNNWTVSVNGNTKTVTDESKFYGSCAYFDGNGDYLQYADSGDWEVDGDFTIELWVKFAHAPDGTNETLIGTVGSGGGNHGFDLGRRNNTHNHASKIGFSFADDNQDWYSLYSDEPLVDNGWHHIAASIDSNTARLFIDGVQQGSTVTHGTGTGHNSPTPLTIGAEYHSSGRHPFQGWMQDVRIYADGKYTSNFTVPNDPNLYPPENQDSLTDTPTNYGTDAQNGGEVRGNYATLNPLNKHNAADVHSQGNLEFTTSSGGGISESTIAISSGKFYYEAEFSASGTGQFTGIRKAGGKNYDDSYIYVGTANKYTDGANATSYGATLAHGDIIGTAFDADNGTLTFYKNGTSQGTAFTSISTANFPYAFVTGSFGSSPTYKVNFGQRPFKHAAPSGFKALCTQNFPDTFGANNNVNEDKNNPSKYFDILTYEGTGSDNDIGGLSFEPDLVWIKNRDVDGQNHSVHDVVRGTTKPLYTDGDAQETTQSSNIELKQFNSDGFQVSDNDRTNDSGESHVGWCWDAGTAASGANNNGSINISAGDQWVNATAGFSITKFTSTGSSGATVGHGLGVPPEFMIIKSVNATGAWGVYHKGIGLPATTDGGLVLNTNAQKNTASDWWASTNPTNDVFSLGNKDTVNPSGSKTMICYAWTPIAGYSSFGTYTGNGNADGPFVYTGFRPRFVLVKNTSNGGNWNLFDSARSTYNPTGHLLLPNDDDDESTESPYNDFLSNGFKLRTNDSGQTGSNANQSSDVYIYAAFAEHPFKTARAR